MPTAVEDNIRIETDMIRRLERAIARMDATDPEEIDSDEYEAMLAELVRRRETLTAIEKRR